MVFRQLSIKDIRRETPDCVSISFDIPDQWKEEFKFKQGQNLTVKMQLAGDEVRRSYSICSSPLDNELRIAVKKVLSGKFSSHANLKLKKGDVLEVLPPTGKFLTELKADQTKNYLAFAAGSGITPVISIIKTTLHTERKSSFTLVYGNRNRSSIIFREEIESLKNKFIDRFRVYHILSREKTDTPLNHGKINAEKCIELTRVIDLSNHEEFFICGPEEMIFSVKNFLEGKGVDKNKIHFELFNTPGEKQLKAGSRELKPELQFEGKRSNITIKLDGISIEFELPYNTHSILEGALKQGAELPYACKGGVCSTCRAKLIKGEVEMDVNYALEQDEIEAGFILTCQSHPRSEKIVVDFDVK